MKADEKFNSIIGIHLGDSKIINKKTDSPLNNTLQLLLFSGKLKCDFAEAIVRLSNQFTGWAEVKRIGVWKLDIPQLIVHLIINMLPVILPQNYVI